MNASHIRPLREADLEALYKIRKIAFLDDKSGSDPDVHQRHLDALPYRFGRFADGELVASATWYPFSMNLAGEPTVVGGLASVASAAATRRRGHVRALLADGLRRLRREGIGWCLEYPFDTRYYRRFGWETIANGSFVEIPIERLSTFERRPSATRVEFDDGLIDRMQDIHATWARGYNFTMLRTEDVRPDWQRLLEGPVWTDAPFRFAFVLDRSYVVLELESNETGQRVTVLDYAFEDASGRHDLLGFLNNFAGQAQTVRLQLATDDPLRLEWSNFSVPHPHPLQARIVDVTKALTGWSTEEKWGHVIHVHDDFCDWNDGTYRVDVEGGRTRAQPTEADMTTADLSLDIRTLARILSGSVSPRAAGRTITEPGDVVVFQALARLPQRACYTSLADYF